MDDEQAVRLKLAEAKTFALSSVGLVLTVASILGVAWTIWGWVH